MNTDQIASEAARDWLLRLRQWQGFDLTEYQQASLIESFQSAIEKALDKSIHPHFTSESRAAHASECKPIPAGYKGCETHHIFGTDCPHASEHPFCASPTEYDAAHANDERYEMALRDSQRRGELLDKAHASEQGEGQTLWQGNRVHELKCWPEFFEEIRLGNKTFELRKDDRNYQQFDRLLLREWKPDTEQFTGRTIQCIVTYLLKGKFGLGDGYVCMSILSQRPTPATDCTCHADAYCKIHGNTPATASGVDPRNPTYAQKAQAHNIPRKPTPATDTRPEWCGCTSQNRDLNCKIHGD